MVNYESEDPSRSFRDRDDVEKSRNRQYSIQAYIVSLPSVKTDLPPVNDSVPAHLIEQESFKNTH